MSRTANKVAPPPTHDVTVTSIGSLVDHLTPDIDERTGHRRSLMVYRGWRTAGDSLLTSLDRLGGVDPPHTKAGLEQFLFRSFARYARPYVASSHPWELLVSAQHHGVPTRLLDWTSSPLIAANFATLRNRGTTAVIWRLDWGIVHARFGLPDIALAIEDVERCFGGAPPFDAPPDRGQQKPFACLLEPPTLEPRIAAQSGSFTVCSDTSCSLDEFLARHGIAGALTRFLIPAEHVPLVRDQLDMLGVDERRLFPDLGGIAATIRRYYA
jgi:hypothetical protein